MSRASGIGSLPGEDERAYVEWVKVVLGELDELAHLPEVPGRGAGAEMTGRGLCVLEGLAADLQPAGWRLVDAPGIDQRRARSLLAHDLDRVEEHGQEYAAAFKIQVAGPWTLAATVEKPRGDKVLADHGARREVAESLAAGISAHVADVRRRLPGASEIVVQVDEPALAAVLAGAVPTASGFSRHRSVDVPEASTHLTWVLEAIKAAGATAWVHACAPQTPWDLILGAGADGICVDTSLLGPADLDVLAGALEDGRTVGLGILPALAPAAEPGEVALTESVLRLLDMLGLDPEVHAERLVITPACGMAGAAPAWARRAYDLARAVARNV